MLKRLLPLLVCLCMVGLIKTTAQENVEELTKLKAEKAEALGKIEAELKSVTGKRDALKSEVDALTEQLTPYPRWDLGAFGTLGLNFTGFNDWFSKDKPNTFATNITFAGNGFANLDQEKYFWRNSTSLTLGWIKFDDKDNPDDSDELEVSADAFNLVSLFGYKLSDHWAVSTLGEYRTSILDGRFNNPGYLDLGVGATWTPIKDLVVVIHPLNYNWVFADDETMFNSSLGAKVVADYKRQIVKGLNWKSNLSIFASYEDTDYSNWTWVNSFSTAYKGLGIGLEVGLRNNKQEALAALKTDNPLQTYYILGFTYSL